jgi:ABC-type bacteriocin/lantibiotic exporter with double-glycine peptidase domain
MSRRLFAPEVVQSSAMDCGPAALKCLLEGFGIPVSYDRLREACQTSLDGTSIDTLESAAGQLGLEASQVMLPLDHLLLPEAQALPALLVVVNPLGVTHFVVVWRRHGPWVQVMDPGAGRRWMPVRELLAETYIHTLPVPAAAWREWAGSEPFLVPLRARMKAIGIPEQDREALLAEALHDPGWRPIAALDAAVRRATALVRSGGIRAGREAAAVVRAVAEDDLLASDGSVIPDPSDDEELLLRGAVLVTIAGRRPVEEKAESARIAGLSPELRLALASPGIRPLRLLFGLLREDGLLTPCALAAALLVAAGAVVLEALIFRGLLDLASRLGVVEQRLSLGALFLCFLTLVLLLEFTVFSGVLGLGRRLEVRLRMRFLEKIARLGDRWFRSRLSSDMAERCHSVYRLRLLPELGANLLRSGGQLALTVAGISWLAPEVAPVAVASAALALLLPVAAQPALRERDLRVRNHAGALGRFYLDSLLGLVPVRNHGAERALRREHEGLLREWMQAAWRLEKTTMLVDLTHIAAGYGFAIWLLLQQEGGQALLLSYWALQIPQLGQQLSIAARQVPLLRNTMARLLEPLAAGGEGLESLERSGAPGTSETAPAGGVSLRFDRVSAVIAGHTVLEDIFLAVEPGRHVAIVGPSGAGKSTLVGLLLGWNEPAQGEIRVDGAPLTADRLDALRRWTAWVDPAVQLWNAPLLDNLLYGTSEGGAGVGEAIEASLLRHLLEELPDGLQTSLGEGGALVSGGEGQRVRLGRALLRPDARLVVLDEPFRGLDRMTRDQLLGRARSWWRGATFLCVTHDVAATRDFDHVVVIEGGRIAEQGRPADLEARGGSRYRALLAEEETVRERFRGEAGWRRMRLVAGALTDSTDEHGRARTGTDRHKAGVACL